MTGEARVQVVSGLVLWQWRSGAIAAAKAAGVAPLEVDWLLQRAAQVDRLSLHLGTVAQQPQVFLQLALSELDHLWQQRIQQRVPVQYLWGSTAWRDFELKVSPAVLIPRPETELIIDLVHRWLTATNHPTLARQGHWADLGTGSGAIAIGLARLLPHATIHGVDQSKAALAMARHNAEILDCDTQIHFYHGSWFDPLPHLQGKLQGLVANPPYIPTPLLADLQVEVIQHEPIAALDGGPDGLESIRHLARQAPDYLVPGGLWLVEIMAGQGEAVIGVLQDQGCYGEIQLHRDLADCDRFISAVRQ